MEMKTRIRTFLKTGKIAHAKEWKVACPGTHFIDVRKMDEWNVYKLEKVFDLSNQLIGVLPFPYSRLRSSPSDIGQICCQTIHALETLINFTTRRLDSHKHHIDIRRVPIATLSSGIPTTGFFFHAYTRLHDMTDMKLRNQILAI